MCAGALVLARVDRLVYGAADPKAGFAGSLGDLVRDPRLNHRLEVTAGVRADEARRAPPGVLQAAPVIVWRKRQDSNLRGAVNP